MTATPRTADMAMADVHFFAAMARSTSRGNAAESVQSSPVTAGSAVPTDASLLGGRLDRDHAGGAASSRSSAASVGPCGGAA